MMSKAEKMVSLLSMIPRRPREFYDRVAAVLDTQTERYMKKKPHYQSVGWDAVVAGLNQSLHTNIEDCLQEQPLQEIERIVQQGITAMPPDAPFHAGHNGDFYLGRLCYALTRIRRPRTIVETGVCYGVTSSFVLKALEVNGMGKLHSIDLPPLGKNEHQFVGRLIPETLRGNWTLNRGSCKAVMPGVIERVGQVDFFIHDSLHTYRNMIWEFETVAPHLATNAVVVADDVEGNVAFQEWVARAAPSYAAVLHEQAKPQTLLGVACL
jgi:hypothetical protein